MKLLPLLRKADGFLDHHPWLLPLFGLLTGVISFVAVKRSDKLALIVAAFVVCGWLWLMIQPLVREWLCRRGSRQVSLTLVNFVTQSIQQEQLFFVLPFLFLSTQSDDLPQLCTTVLVALAAIATTWDPFYARYIARHYPTRVGFQCFCSFITAMTVLPMALTIPLEKSFYIALFFVMVWMMLILPFCLRKPKRLWQQATLLVVIPLLLWGMRAHIPAAGLEVKDARLTGEQVEDQLPVNSLEQITLSELQRGLYLHAAISAPFGLRQDIIFDWKHNDYSEQIIATITGGRREGYRTHAHKQHFMDTALGHWDVDILTPQGQLLKRVSFEVVPG
jgi:hypothetical protein